MNYTIEHLTRSLFFTGTFPFVFKKVRHLKQEFPLQKRFVREFWKITYVVSGSGSFVINDQRWPIRPHSILLVHPGAVTTYEIASETLDICNILFDKSFIEDNLARLKDDYSFFAVFSDTFRQEERAILYVQEATNAMRDVIRVMENEYGGRGDNRIEILRLKLAELLILMLRGCADAPRPARKRAMAEFARRYIEGHSGEAVTQESAARRVGVTPSHFCRVFRESTGVTFKEFLRDTRLKKAAMLLKDGKTGSISEICYQCGFNDLSYFYRAFRARFGKSPGSWRKSFGLN